MDCECYWCKSFITDMMKKKGWYKRHQGHLFCSAICANLWDISGGEDVKRT